MTPADFTAAVTTHRRLILYVCRSLLPVAEDAEDAVQDAVMKAWLARARMPLDPDYQRRWLAMIARNVCLDHLRKARRRPVMVAEDARIASPISVENTVLVRCELAETFAALDAMPPLDRGALMATAMGYRAGELRIRNGAMKARVWRARERLVRLRMVA